MIDEIDSGYMCSKCYLPILESILVFDDENYKFYHKECEYKWQEELK